MPSIQLHAVSVEFPVYGVANRFLKREFVRLLTGGVLQRDTRRCVTVRALDRVSFHVPDGMRLGLIGHNGSGKTTLLRMIAGIYTPTGGEVHIEGEVATLLDMMIGFDEESTGEEIIRVRGLLQGLSWKQASFRMDAIAEITGLGDFLMMPVRTYSTGMKMRLAFGISTQMNPEILVIDEIFGAGDAEFQQRAQERMHAMIDASNILVFTSHDLELVRRLCTHVAVLEAGRLVFFGETEAGMDFFLGSIPCKAALQ